MVFTRLLRLISRPRTCKPEIMYGPSNLQDEEVEIGFDGTDAHVMRSELVTQIEFCYLRAKMRGFCFGLLEPHSNIIVNRFIDMAVVDEEEEEEEYCSRWQRGGQMSRRSLDGLVAFLAALFPHLSDAQAVWYLHKAKADPLVAALIIAKHRRMDVHSLSVEMALRCAATAARHPNPKRFLAGWRKLSPSLDKLAALMLSDDDLAVSVPAMETLLLHKPLSPPPFDLKASCWDLASSRLAALRPDLGLRGVVFPGRTAMRCLLLNTIHGYYLQAIARLPRDQLCSRQMLYSMLHYGHCFGPLDPVSNILINTIWWYNPSDQNPNDIMDMISTRALLRIVVRSFYGLVSFLCTRYAALTVDQAMHDLLVAGADLRIADPNLHHGGASVEHAYAVAAFAALHPKPHAQVELLRQSNMIFRMGSLYLKGNGQLSSEVVHRLISTTTRSRGPPEISELDRLTSAMVDRVDRHRKSFWNQHARVVAMVKSALDMYNGHAGVPKYELHVVCGVNDKVHGPQYITADNQIYHHSHINFLATCKDDGQSAGALPVLFFAQWSNDGTKEGCFCCPVPVPSLDSEHVRCLYCEYQGSRIVHPANQIYHGRDIEFDKMLCGELYSGDYTNNYIIKNSCTLASWVNGLADDSIFSTSHIRDCVYEDQEDWVPQNSIASLVRYIC